jgi:hypothetical protein
MMMPSPMNATDQRDNFFDDVPLPSTEAELELSLVLLSMALPTTLGKASYMIASCGQAEAR